MSVFFRAVTNQELIPIIAPVMPMESCIKPFLKSCDKDSDEKITLKEWGRCLGLKEGKIKKLKISYQNFKIQHVF